MNAFVLDGEMACCGRKAVENPTRFKREVETGPRGRLSVPVRQAILAHQDNRCLYCGVTLGDWIMRGTRAVKTKIHWDHMVPYAYSGCSEARNMAAACHVCNFIKHDKVFQTVEEASVYIAAIREAKGYTVL